MEEPFANMQGSTLVGSPSRYVEWLETVDPFHRDDALDALEEVEERTRSLISDGFEPVDAALIAGAGALLSHSGSKQS